MDTEYKNTTQPIVAENTQILNEKESSQAASAELYGHVSMVVREVESRYREGILAYIDVLARYKEETDALTQKLMETKTVAAPKEAKLSMLVQEVHTENRLLERLNSEFLQKVADYEAFEHEYSPLMKEGNADLLKHSKLGEIARLNDEIEEGEMKLLSLELERLNQTEKLEPIRLEMVRIEQALAELERKKRYFETTHLQQMHLRPDTDSLLPASSFDSSTKEYGS